MQKNTYSYVVACLLFFCSYGSLLGQKGKLKFERITLEHGLVQGHIFDIVEDSIGFIYFSTGGGLARYDGYEFKNHHYDSRDSSTLSSNWIHTSYLDNNQDIWVGTNNGLNKIDIKSGKCQRYYHDPNNSNSIGSNVIRHIIKDREGVLWVSHNNGVDRYNETTNDFTRVNIKGYASSRHGSKLLDDGRDTLWLTSASGVYRIHMQDLSYEHLFLDDDWNWPGVMQTVYGIFQGPDHGVWLGTERGVWEYNAQSGTFSQVRLNDKIDIVQCRTFLLDRSNRMWVGTNSEGLYCFDYSSLQFKGSYKYNPTEPNGINNNNIYSLHQDAWGNIWIGTFNGINKINPEAEKFPFFQNEAGLDNFANLTLRVYEDSKGFIWTNTMEGFFRLDPSHKRGESYFTEPYLSPGRFHSIGDMQELQGYMWYLLRGVGLVRGNPDTKESKLVENVEFFKEGATLYEMDVSPDYPDHLWITTSAGLCKYNIKTGNNTWYFPMEQYPEIESNFLSLLSIGHNNQFCIAGPKGIVFLFDPEKESFQIFRFQKTQTSTSVMGLAYNEHGIFVGEKNGMSWIDLINNDYYFFNSYDGMQQDDISSLQSDIDGNIWMASLNYLIKFEPLTKEFSNYSISHSIKESTTFASYRTKDGKLLFGGSDGVVAFYPKEVTIDSIAPRPVLTQIKVLNEPLHTDPGPEYLKELHISYTDKVITFHYTGLQMTNPKYHEYRYMLEGFDLDWQYAGDKRDVTYTNLRPGKYIFKVQSANGDGVWSKQSLSLDLYVGAPYWQTTWFYLLIVLISLSIIYAFIDNRRQSRKLAQEKEIAEKSAHYKSLFLANMSHEIRTPMNAIVGMSKLMFDTPLNPKQQEYAHIIRESAENLLVIINDILDHSKIESGKYSFEHRVFETELLLNQLKTLFQYKANEKKLEFSIITDPALPARILGDPTRLNQILINLLSNAIKFTSKGSVELQVSVLENHPTSCTLKFIVRDTGIGIPEDMQEKIFESFQQAQDTYDSGNLGTGLGLAIAKQLIEQQGGHVHVSSIPNQGTTFEVTLPFDKPGVEDQSPIQEAPYAAIMEQPIRFLLVEDTRFNQMLAVEILKKYFPKSDIDIADNGAVALEKLMGRSYDLILMDVKMPIMDGYEATSKIRSDDNYSARQTPIIGLTANAIQSQLDTCLQVGMNDVITKPLSGEELAAKISVYITQINYDQS